MAAASDLTCLSELGGLQNRNISFVSGSQPCNRSTVRAPPYTPQATAAFAITITFMMIMTIVGNILVIIAVLTSRSLKVAQNLFLVSLAAADILVATLVIPFSLAYELLGYWAFSSIWCEIYRALDVLFCTSSIVHLCAIALDRYLSLSRPVSYGTKRTPTCIKAAIIVVWLISAVISFPPLLTLDKSKDGEEVCELNAERWYILYSTIGSFFAPCVIMILVYVRIYQIAKRHTRCPPGRKKKSLVEGNTGMTRESATKQLQQNGDQGAGTSSTGEKVFNVNSKLLSLQNTVENVSRDSVPQSGEAEKFTSSPPCSNQTPTAVPTKESQKHLNEECGVHLNNTPSSGSDTEPGNGNENVPTDDSKEKRNQFDKQHLRLSESKEFKDQNPSLACRYKSTIVTSSGTKLKEETQRPQGTPTSRRKAMVNREKRFTFVLAVVMGVFVICWFPFFFSYSLQAVCPETCSIPNQLFVFFFWIGYCNSCLNPVIYTIFNKDFRKAFKRILYRDTKGTFF
ncbi:alpha-2B adrenergic receptor [Pholidichthys leucotaenia]